MASASAIGERSSRAGGDARLPTITSNPPAGGRKYKLGAIGAIGARSGQERPGASWERTRERRQSGARASTERRELHQSVARAAGASPERHQSDRFELKRHQSVARASPERHQSDWSVTGASAEAGSGRERLGAVSSKAIFFLRKLGRAVSSKAIFFLRKLGRARAHIFSEEARSIF